MDPLEIAQGNYGAEQLARGRRFERLVDRDETVQRGIN
jgi:hypothetical protein